MVKVGLRIGDATDWGGGDRGCMGSHLEQKMLTPTFGGNGIYTLE
jgi:hypothetical protein